ncbi:TetR/AcrR family transcriptional regulator [Pseudomonas sp. TE21394]
MCSAQLSYSERTNHVVEVAIRVFSREGYHAVSLRSLAAHVGLSSGSLYTHIASKQELLFSIVEKALRSKKDTIFSELGRCHNSDKQLSTFIRAVITHAARDRASLVLADREIGSLSEWQQEAIQKIQEDIDLSLRRAIRAHLKQKEQEDNSLAVMIKSIGILLNSYLYLPDDILSNEHTIDLYNALAQTAIQQIRR